MYHKWILKSIKTGQKAGKKRTFIIYFFPRLTALECSVVTMKFSDFRDSLKDLHPCYYSRLPYTL